MDLVSEQQFRTVCQQKLPQLRMIYFALSGGVLALSVVVLALSGHPPKSSLTDQAVNLVRTGSWMNLAITLLATIFATYLRSHPQLFWNNVVANNPPARSSSDKAYAAIQASRFVPLVIQEGAAIFGGVICLVAATKGVLQTDGRLWLNMASPALFFVQMVRWFPSAESMLSDFRDVSRSISH